MNMRPNDFYSLGLENTKEIYYNYDYTKLIEHEIKNDECTMTSSGSTAVDTGDFTGRSPKDKYFVKQSPSEDCIAWNHINQATTSDVFDELFLLTKKQLSNKDIYITDAFCGSSDKSKLKVRFVSEIAWQSHFVKNMFIRPEEDELADFIADFTIYNACKATNKNYKKHGLNSEVFVIFNMEKKDNNYRWYLVRW